MKTRTHNTTKPTASTKPSLQRQQMEEALVGQAAQHARRSPNALTPSQVIHLQRTVGNRAVGQFLAASVQRQVIQRKPNSDANNTVEIDTDDHTYIVDSNQVTSKTATPNAPGNVRYVRTDGVGDCIAIAMQGQRQTDGVTVSLFAHLSSHQYLKPSQGGKMNNETPDYVAVKNFAEGMDNTQAVAVTNYDGGLNLDSQTKPGIRPLYNAGKNQSDFIFDSQQFDIHSVGKKIHGVAQVLESVQDHHTEQERFEEAEEEQRNRPRRKKTSVKSQMCNVQ